MWLAALPSPPRRHKPRLNRAERNRLNDPATPVAGQINRSALRASGMASQLIFTGWREPTVLGLSTLAAPHQGRRTVSYGSSTVIFPANLLLLETDGCYGPSTLAGGLGKIKSLNDEIENVDGYSNRPKTPSDGRPASANLVSVAGARRSAVICPESFRSRSSTATDAGQGLSPGNFP